MEFTCSKIELSAAVGASSRAVSSRTSTPVLSGMFLVANGDTVNIHATDYEIGTVATFKAAIAEAGKVIVPGRFFYETVKAMPGDTVTVKTDGNVVNIFSDKSKFSLLSMGSSDFPSVSPLKGGAMFSIDGEAFKNLVRRTAFACATDETRPVFTGVLFEVKGGKVCMVATNSHRLSFCDAPVAGEAEVSVIVPRRVLDEVCRVLAGSDKVEVSVTSNEASFRVGKFFFVTRLIAGKFPDFRKAIPKSSPMVATVPVATFAPALARVGLIARSSEFNTVKLSFKSGSVEISSTNPTVGKARESVNIGYSGDAFNISFNAGYLAEAFKVIDSDVAVVEMNGALTPAVIRDPGCNGFLHILTPVRAKS